jgi:small subunit ribosomal protein S16
MPPWRTIVGRHSPTRQHLDEPEDTNVVKLRLMRMGKKKQPFYRVVAADARSPRNGRLIEIVGTYDPRAEPSGITIDNSKAVEWLRKGAQPTERVEKLLKVSGAWDEFKGLPSGTSVTAPPAPKAPK